MSAQPVKTGEVPTRVKTQTTPCRELESGASVQTQAINSSDIIMQHT